MSRLNSFYSKWLYSKKAVLLFTAATLWLFLAFFKRGEPALLILNFLLISIAVAAFEYGYAFSYFISAVISVVVFISIGYNPAFKLPYLVSIIFLNVVALVPGYYNRIYNERHISKNSALDKVRISYNELLAELNRLKDAKASLENQVYEILGLYEVTKKMGASLDMTETLLVFRAAVNKILKFSKLRLLLLVEAQDSPIVTYEILAGVAGSPEKASPSGISKVQSSQFDQILVEDISSRKEVVYLKSPIEAAHPFRRYLVEQRGSFIALPLLSEGVTIGVLVILGAEEEEIEKISIMAEQLALEVKKVNLYEKVQTLAITDGLTKIYVRRHFLERLNEEVARSKRHKLNLSLLMLDIDHFKQCNDTYGHLVGDIILKEFAKIMKEHVRLIDLIGRYGGEEFVIALPDTNKSSAASVAERLRQSIENYRFKAYDEVIRTTVSIGLAAYPDDGSDVPTLIDRADQALYKAKEEGRNRVIFWP